MAAEPPIMPPEPVKRCGFKKNKRGNHEFSKDSSKPQDDPVDEGLENKNTNTMCSYKETIKVDLGVKETIKFSGRRIQENIIITQELALSMNKMIGRIGYFAIKVDLSKAYDKLNWDFTERALEEIGLPLKLRHLIKVVVTIVQTNMKWNGGRALMFCPQRGIRQGDPISPYIVVLCMEKLSHVITNSVNKGDWKGLRAGREGPIISHLMFADDLLLFGQATMEQL